MSLAIRLYESGIVPTKGKAALAAGLSKASFYIKYRARNKDPRHRAIAERTKAMIEDKIVNMTEHLDKVSAEAIGELRTMMKNSAVSEMIRYKAAVDLADRGPRTSKIMKVQSTQFSLNGQDVKELASALVAAKEARLSTTDGLSGDCVKTPADTPELPTVLPNVFRRSA